MKIVVLQRSWHELQGIKECVKKIDPQKAEEISYVTRASEVWEKAARCSDLFVVCAELILPNVRCHSLALALKIAKPAARFFIYDVSLAEVIRPELLPEEIAAVDGRIPRRSPHVDDHDLLARVLASDLRHMTLAGLRAAFPEIELTRKEDG